MKAIALVLMSVAIAGCGGGPSASSGNSATAVPDASPTPTGDDYHRHHRRRHHRHGTYGAAATTSASGSPVAAPSSGGSWPCDDSKFERDRQQLASGALQGDQEVDVCGTVTRVLPAKETRSGEHGYYFIQIAPGDSIEIVSDLGELNAPSWPWVKAGDYSYVQGRYYYDSASSQGIDWTHHGTSRSWESPGYVVVDGTEYQ
jgi:hypothetical protein